MGWNRVSDRDNLLRWIIEIPRQRTALSLQLLNCYSHTDLPTVGASTLHSIWSNYNNKTDGIYEYVSRLSQGISGSAGSDQSLQKQCGGAGTQGAGVRGRGGAGAASLTSWLAHVRGNPGSGEAFKPFTLCWPIHDRAARCTMYRVLPKW